MAENNTVILIPWHTISVPNTVCAVWKKNVGGSCVRGTQLKTDTTTVKLHLQTAMSILAKMIDLVMVFNQLIHKITYIAVFISDSLVLQTSQFHINGFLKSDVKVLTLQSKLTKRNSLNLLLLLIAPVKLDIW